MLLNSVEYCINSYDVLSTPSWKLIRNKSSFILSDRGAGADHYRSRIEIYSTKSALETMVEYIELQRASSDTITIDLSTRTEKIFGADIDYSSPLTVVVVQQGQILQNTWKGYRIELELQLQSPSFTGTATLPDLNYSNHNFNAGATRTKTVRFSYENDILSVENNSDYGTFTGTFYFNDTNAANAKRFYFTQRGTPFYLDEISGLDYLFGKKRKIMFPAKVRMIGFKEFYNNPNRWRCNIEFAEEV